MWACGPIGVPRKRLPFEQFVEPSNGAESLESFDLNNCDARKQNKPTWTNTPPERSSRSAYSSTSLPAMPSCPSLSLSSRYVTNNLRAVPLYSRMMRDRRHPTASSSIQSPLSSALPPTSRRRRTERSIRLGVTDLILAYLRAANICWRATGSTGLTRWALKPASRERLRSSSCPQPVTATRTMSLPHGCSRIRRAAS